MTTTTPAQGAKSPAASEPAPAGTIRFDPSLPVPVPPSRLRGLNSRSRQRERRAEILAAIRRLLLRHGCAGIAMRSIAAESGHAVQTIYNLVGPRDAAIIEAISEYTRHVGSGARHDPRQLHAAVALIDQWMDSVEAEPEFCRQVSLVALTPARAIFHAIRERQMKGLLGLMLRQQKLGVLRRDANLRDLAEQMAFGASALCVEWADRPFPVAELRRRLGALFTNLLASAAAPGAGRLRVV